VDRIIADLGVALRMRRHPAAKRPGAHLGAEADAEERLVFLERDRDPVDLAADEIVGVVGAHRTAENDGGGMILKRRRQRIAEPGPAHVELKSELPECVADPPGRRVLLVQNNQNRQWHGVVRNQASSRKFLCTFAGKRKGMLRRPKAAAGGHQPHNGPDDRSRRFARGAPLFAEWLFCGLRRGLLRA
jgi:hypothetical protein